MERKRLNGRSQAEEEDEKTHADGDHIHSQEKPIHFHRFPALPLTPPPTDNLFTTKIPPPRTLSSISRAAFSALPSHIHATLAPCPFFQKLLVPLFCLSLFLSLHSSSIHFPELHILLSKYLLLSLFLSLLPLITFFLSWSCFVCCK